MTTDVPEEVPVPYVPINVREKLARFTEHWSPRIIARMNDYHLKLAKIQGEFIWHSHAETDEVFIILDGEMTILFPDGEVSLRSGDVFVVPKGQEHKPVARQVCAIMLIEAAGTVNTGEVQSDLTAKDDVWI
jgi:mannose-6-phosphate isomerase-like protein (cupin superfamily)